MPENLQSDARALASPSRNAIFRYLAGADEPVGVAELTDHVGLNHNAVRQHLAVLVDAGLVTEGTAEPGSRGRPRLLYRLSPEAAGRWETAGPYQYLAGLLASALESGRSPREAGRDAGRAAVPRRVDDSVDPVDVVEEQMRRGGFRPTRTTRGTKVDFVLGRCPFEAVASASPDAVCQLHLGLAEGLAQGLGGFDVERLVRKNPHRGGCRVALRRTPAPGSVRR